MVDSYWRSLKSVSGKNHTQGCKTKGKKKSLTNKQKLAMVKKTMMVSDFGVSN